MIKTIFNVIGWLVVFYIIGFVVCLLAFMGGGDGSDVLSQHYGSVISLFIR